MKVSERDLVFSFDSAYTAIKFDENPFYRDYCNHMPGGKGVDIVADSDEIIHLVEIKNCLGHEAENRWRTSTDNRKLDSAPRDLDVENRDSFDIEVVKKVAMTILCLFGAWSKAEKTEKALELEDYWKALSSAKVQKDKKQIIVTLFLEGNFSGVSQTRTKKAIMKRIQESISKKLDWLNCKVFVVDSDTYNDKFFTVGNNFQV